MRPQVAGMRPGEVVLMRGIDLDTTGKVWLYQPGSDPGPHGRHKTAWRGHRKVIAIGPKGQEILKPWLRLNLTEYLFQPREAMAAFRAQQRQNRKSKVQPSQKNRRKAKAKKAPGERYTSRSYAQAIAKAVLTANKVRACETCKTLKPAKDTGLNCLPARQADRIMAENGPYLSISIRRCDISIVRPCVWRRRPPGFFNLTQGAKGVLLFKTKSYSPSMKPPACCLPHGGAGLSPCPVTCCTVRGSAILRMASKPTRCPRSRISWV
jgi:hypothetical protein